MAYKSDAAAGGNDAGEELRVHIGDSAHQHAAGAGRVDPARGVRGGPPQHRVVC